MVSDGKRRRSVMGWSTAQGVLKLSRHAPNDLAARGSMDFHGSRVVPGIDVMNGPLSPVRLILNADPFGQLPVATGKLRRAEPGPAPAALDRPRQLCVAAQRFVGSLDTGERRRLVDNLVDNLLGAPVGVPLDLRARSLALLEEIDLSLAQAVEHGTSSSKRSLHLQRAGE